MRRIAIVSNRLPSFDGKQAAAGGLAIGLSAALRESGGTWLGWDGQIAAGAARKGGLRQCGPFDLATLPLSQREHAGYYLGFSNRTLWPLLHGRADLVHFAPPDYATYRAVNHKFAQRLAPLMESHDLAWVHDYHLLLLGQELRRLGVGAPIGFFLHVPFPAPDTLATLPCHRDLIAALSAYDLVGFQTERDVRNFREFVLWHLGGAVSNDGTVFAMGRKFRVGAFSIGIDTRRFEAAAASKEVARLGEHLHGCFRGRVGIVGVDRLDYTKGLPQRLRAFERLIETAPAYRGRTFLLQVAAPSREGIPEYANLKDELDSLSGAINARHADVDWTPVRYLNRAFSQMRLAALYRSARVGLVTPLRDGMNLVAKEYVAAQDPRDPGVLVLSRFAGAAERLKGAVLVNPYDIDEVAEALHDALEMPLEERRARWSEMIVEMREHDIHDWRDRFLGSLEATRQRAKGAPRVPEVTLAPLPEWRKLGVFGAARRPVPRPGRSPGAARAFRSGSAPRDRRPPEPPPGEAP